MLTPGPEDQRHRITVEQAETDYFAKLAKLPDLSRANPSRREQLQKPFGFINDEWVALKTSMQPGDELWEYCTNRRAWDNQIGRHYIQLVRNGTVVTAILLDLS